MTHQRSTVRNALPQVLPVITPAPTSSADLFRRFEAQQQRISTVLWQSRAMYRMLLDGHTRFALLDLPLFFETGQVVGYMGRLRRLGPVVVLAEEEIDAVACFEAGAHDVLRRQAQTVELLTRLGARWRRPSNTDSIRLSARRTMHSDDLNLQLYGSLPEGEQLLFTLLGSADRVMTRVELRASLGAGNVPISDRALTQLVYRLNLKLGPYGLLAASAAKIGYRLVRYGGDPPRESD